MMILDDDSRPCAGLDQLRRRGDGSSRLLHPLWGQVLSIILNRYVYTILSPAPRAAHLISANHSLFHQHAPDQDALWDGNLSLPRAILEAFGSPNRIDVFI
ncbi:MAG: hypothetical protein NZ572_07875 [Thermoflexus sp.]|nr:hypothetical protein [Thermoflexus sp.]